MVTRSSSRIAAAVTSRRFNGRVVDPAPRVRSAASGRPRAGAWDVASVARTLAGPGARGEPQGVLATGVQALRALDESGTRVVALDLPTGVNADTGEIARRAVRADLTVTFGAPKRGHFLYPCRAFVGALEVVDIGLVTPEPGDPEYAIELASAVLDSIQSRRSIPVPSPLTGEG